MYAIFETGGKQYKVENGSVLFIEKLEAAENEVVNFDKVLLLDDGKKDVKVGTPYLSSILVAGKVLKHGKDKKITVFTYKAKKNEKRKLGHRQPYTKIEIVGIGTAATVKKQVEQAGAKSADAKTTTKAADAKKAEKTVDEATEKPAVKKTTTAKKPAAKKTTTAEKPAAKKTTTAKKPAAKKTTTAEKPAAKKTSTAKKPAAKKEETADKAE